MTSAMTRIPLRARYGHLPPPAPLVSREPVAGAVAPFGGEVVPPGAGAVEPGAGARGPGAGVRDASGPRGAGRGQSLRGRITQPVRPKTPFGDGGPLAKANPSES